MPRRVDSIQHEATFLILIQKMCRKCTAPILNSLNRFETRTMMFESMHTTHNIDELINLAIIPFGGMVRHNTTKAVV